jgi:hypothetical protein
MSSSKIKKEIECLTRLQGLTGQLEDILIFLKLEGLIDDNQMRSVKQSSDHPKEIQSLLRDLQVRQKFQMLTYEWIVLPVENIIITIVTDMNQKEFIFNG